jgi:hypothetical protein
VAFTNNAIQLAISRGDAHLVDLNDVIALAVALDLRAKEMNVLLLDLAVVMNDIVLLTEYSVVLGPLRDELKREMAR